MTQGLKDLTAPSIDDIIAVVEAARSALPDAFRPAADQVLLRVEEFPLDDMLDELSIDDAFDLTGLYDGTPLTEKSVMDPPARPDTIWLFRRPILDEWAGRGDVTFGELVAHVYVHELAHHFGWSDEDIARIDQWWQ